MLNSVRSTEEEMIQDKVRVINSAGDTTFEFIDYRPESAEEHVGYQAMKASLDKLGIKYAESAGSEVIFLRPKRQLSEKVKEKLYQRYQREKVKLEDKIIKDVFESVLEETQTNSSKPDRVYISRDPRGKIEIHITFPGVRILDSKSRVNSSAMKEAVETVLGESLSKEPRHNELDIFDKDIQERDPVTFAKAVTQVYLEKVKDQKQELGLPDTDPTTKRQAAEVVQAQKNARKTLLQLPKFNPSVKISDI